MLVAAPSCPQKPWYPSFQVLAMKKKAGFTEEMSWMKLNSKWDPDPLVRIVLVRYVVKWEPH